MTLQEKIAYREAMKEMAVESYNLFNRYQDEVNRLNIEIAEEMSKHVKGELNEV